MTLKSAGPLNALSAHFMSTASHMVMSFPRTPFSLSFWNAISSVPVILTGDFNSPEENPVYIYVGENGYESSFKNVHGKEPAVTHRDHTGQQLSVDYIFYKNSTSNKIEPKSSVLLPEEYNDMEWPEEFQISDHRMIVTEFELESKLHLFRSGEDKK